jgi:Flp pilus assembly CpaF family ATPase
MGKHRWVMAYQERVATTIDSKPITSSHLMSPAMRTGSDLLVIGEVRDSEAGAFLRAMQTGQGSMATVHGGSAAEGIEVLVDLATAATGQRRHDVKVQAYRAADLIVHLDGSNEEGRWVNEIVAPSIEDEGERFILHRIYAESDIAPDQRARPAKEPPISMMRRLKRRSPDFDGRWWTNPDDTYKPLQIGGID